MLYMQNGVHCVPTTVEPMKKLALQLGIPIKLYNIDTEDVKKADEMVRRYGDWSEDYIIPQVFFEFDNGEIKHVLTGYSEGVQYTRGLSKTCLIHLFSSRLYEQKEKVNVIIYQHIMQLA